MTYNIILVSHSIIKSMNFKLQSLSNWCIHSLKRYFSAVKWDRNTICVVFNSLNFLKPVRVQNVHLLSQYTSNNNAEQSDIPSRLLLMEYHWWHVQNSVNTGFLGTNLTRTLPQCLLWGSAKPVWLHQHSRYELNFSFFRTDLSTHPE